MWKLRQPFLLLVLLSVGHVVGNEQQCSAGKLSSDSLAQIGHHVRRKYAQASPKLSEGEDEQEDNVPEEEADVAPEDATYEAESECGTREECEVKAIIEDAKMKVPRVAEELATLNITSPALPEYVSTGSPALVERDSVEACTADLSSLLSKPQEKALEKPEGADYGKYIAAGASATGTIVSAVGGVAAIGLTMSAAAGPVGLMAMGVGLALVGTLGPLFGGGDPGMSEHQVRELVEKMINQRTDQIVQGVQDEMNRVANCLHLHINQAVFNIKRDLARKMVRDTLVEFGNLRNIMSKQHNAHHDCGAFNSVCYRVNSLCNQVTTLTAEINDYKTVSAAIVPLVKHFNDICYANSWAWLAGAARMANCGWSVQTVFAMTTSMQRNFEAFFKVVPVAQHYAYAQTIAAHPILARSSERLMNVLQEHLNYGLIYPEVGSHWNWWSRARSFVCRTCGFTDWKYLGRRKYECEGYGGGGGYYGGGGRYGGGGGGRGSYEGRRYGGGRLLETESEVSGNVSSSSRCKYFYYVGSYYSARRVPESQLPQQAEGGGRRAAQWKGNDWGYYSYVCKHTSFQFYTQIDGLRRCDGMGGISYPTGMA